MDRSRVKHGMTKGFTLAEVLITLGIIGVVAAITIPSLIAKYQMKVFETGFKKQYAVLQDAINYLTLENGYYRCYVYLRGGGYTAERGDCTALKNDLVSKLQLTPINDNYKNKYASSAKVVSEGGTVVNSACYYDTVYKQSYVTKDGAELFITSSAGLPGIVIDINGEKGPNKWGYDVYWMVFSNHQKKTEKILLTDEYCSMAEKGGLLPRSILRNQKKNTSTSWFW